MQLTWKRIILYQFSFKCTQSRFQAIKFNSKTNSNSNNNIVHSFRTMSSTISPPQSLLKPINVPSKTLMGPGPSSGAPRVLAAGALPLLGHLHSEFTQVMANGMGLGID